MSYVTLLIGLAVVLLALVGVYYLRKRQRTLQRLSALAELERAAYAERVAQARKEEARRQAVEKMRRRNRGGSAG